MKPFLRILPLGAAIALPANLEAAVGGMPAPVVMNSGDAAWLMTAAIFGLVAVLGGLGLRYVGQLRAKNFVSVFAQIFAVAAIVSLLWIAIGYSLVFANGTAVIGGLDLAMMAGLGAVFPGSTVPETIFAFFQMVFAIFAVTIMTGAWAERARFGWVVAFAFLWTLIVYAPIAHWIWGDGWLAQLGVLDFAGGLTVHVSAGVSALVVAILIGRRTDLASGPIAPQAATLTLAGTALLWAGWFGLVGGAGATADFNAGAAILNAQAAASMAALAWAVADKIRTGKASATGIATGALVGLVAISPAANAVGAAGAMLIGLGAALFCRFAAGIVRRGFSVDDPLGVFAIHAGGGAVGAFAVAILIAPIAGGVGYPEGTTMISQLITQVIAITAVALWSGLATAMIAWIAGIVFPMRASETGEAEGLDLFNHGERGWGG